MSTPANALPQLDLSKSVPLNQASPTQTSAALPQLDLSKSVPLNANTDTTGTTGGSGFLNKVGDVLNIPQNLETGFVKGVGDTVSGISHLIHKIPVVGETLAPQQGIDALDQMTPAHGVAEHVGKFGENIAEF